jgi:hypothetical protein
MMIAFRSGCAAPVVLFQPIARYFEFRLFETVRSEDRNFLAAQIYADAP